MTLSFDVLVITFRGLLFFVVIVSQFFATSPANEPNERTDAGS
jgi:hypothetical protein